MTEANLADGANLPTTPETLPFNPLENVFTKSRCDRYADDIGMDWNDFGDYIVAYELDKIRGRVREMTRGLIARVAEADEVEIEEGVQLGERLVEVIKEVAENHEGYERRDLKRLVMDELAAECDSVGDWRKFLRYTSYVASGECDELGWEDWERDCLVYDAVENGYLALLTMMIALPLRRTKKLVALPLEPGQLNGQIE